MTTAGGRAAATTDVEIAGAYSASASSWGDGPGAVYDRLAEVLLAHSPVSVRGATVIDIGAGTGAASLAAVRAGARRVLAVDVADAMLAVNAARRPPAIVAEATRLPFRRASFDVAVAALSFNHLRDPAAGFVEAARVVAGGGAVVASAYAADDAHPVKRAVEQALGELGWTPPRWQIELYRDRAPLLATVDGCAAVVRSAGLVAEIRNVRVAFPNLTAQQWVMWRLGMAQHAPFVAALPEDRRRHVVRLARRLLGDDPPPLVRSIMIVAVRR